jgi:hypothetical protein
VVLLPDTGRNYLSKVFDDDWIVEIPEVTPEDLERPFRVFEEGT